METLKVCSILPATARNMAFEIYQQSTIVNKSWRSASIQILSRIVSLITLETNAH